MPRGDALRRLHGALEARGLRHAHGWRCPAHEDHSPSLSVNQGSTGAVLHCHAGCEHAAVLEALGLDARDLFDERKANGPTTLRAARLERPPASRPQGPPTEPRAPRGAPPSVPTSHAGARSSPQRTAVYLYVGRDGEAVARKVRLEPGYDGKAKTFLWERPKPDGTWELSKGAAPELLYLLPELVECEDPVHFCEGEKAVDALVARGFNATCPPSGKLTPELLEPLRGRAVWVWADRDEPGEARARAVRDALQGLAASVRVVQSAVSDEHADAFDHLQAGLGLEAVVPWSERHAFDVLVLSGPPLLALLERPVPPPIVPGLPPPGHFTCLVAPPFVGKTSLALWVSLHVLAGEEPWSEVGKLEPGRVLYLSIDASAEELVRRLNSLSTFAPRAHIRQHATGFSLIAQDRELVFDTAALQLHAAGLEQLEHGVALGSYRYVWLDAYANFLPPGESENSNETAARIGGGLEQLAIRTGAAVTLLHHTARPPREKGAPDPGLAFAPRGASALAASARTIFKLEELPGFPYLRRLRCKSNLGPGPAAITLAVASEKTPEQDAVLYFKRAADPVSTIEPEQVLIPGEVLPSLNELAKRLEAIQAPLCGERTYRDLASVHAHRWQRAERVVLGPGKRNATTIALRVQATATPEPEEDLW